VARFTSFRGPPQPPRHFIRQWRLHRGLSQKKLAEMIGVTLGGMSQVERGLINHTQPMLEALATVLQCTPADLLRDPTSGI